MRWWCSFAIVSTLALWTTCAGLEVHLREEAGVGVDASDTFSSDASEYTEQGFDIQSVSGSRDGETDQTTTGQVSVWTPEAMTETTIRIALDAVRYRNNYEKYITTRLCLHRINLIRSRLVDDLESYLFSVDGCESTKITLTGRCNIYYYKLATYELKVPQKTVDKDVYVVQSIFKALTQKSMSELIQPTNLDYKDPAGTSDEESAVLTVKVAGGTTISTGAATTTAIETTTAVTTSASRHDANLQVKAVELSHITEAELQPVTLEQIHARPPPQSVKMNEVLGRPVFTAIPGLWFVMSAAVVAVATIGIASVVAYRQHHHHHPSHHARRRERQQRRRYRLHPEQIQVPLTSLASPVSSEMSQLLASNDDYAAV
ncbi:hypothetical protein FI667_g3605, partial [Globisporangium splendens]